MYILFEVKNNKKKTIYINKERERERERCKEPPQT